LTLIQNKWKFLLIILSYSGRVRILIIESKLYLAKTFRTTLPKQHAIIKLNISVGVFMKIFFRISLFLLLSSQIYFAQNFWEHTNGPGGGDIYSLFVAYNGNIFISTVTGVFRSTDNGDSWSGTGFISDIVNCFAENFSGDIFAGTDYGGVFRSTDNGGSWIQTGFANAYVLSMAISFQDIFVGTDNGIYFSYDDGDTWTQIGLENTSISSIVINWSGEIFAGIYGGWIYEGVYRSTDYGSTWTAVNNGLTNTDISALAINYNEDLLASTYGGGVFRSTDDGDNWIAINNGLTSMNIYFIDIDAGGNFFVETTTGLFRSTDNGISWTNINSDFTYYLVNSLDFNYGVIFAGTNGGVFRSTDNGDTWAASNYGLTNIHIRSLVCNTSNDIFAGVNSLGVFRSTDNGDNWTRTSLPDVQVRSLAINLSGDIFAGSYGAGIYRSTDNGDTWVNISNGLFYYVRTVAINAMGDIFLGAEGGLFYSTDNGESWSLTGLTDVNVSSLAINDSGNIFAGAYYAPSSGVFISTDNGNTWTQLNNGLTNSNVRCLAINQSGDIFAGTYGEVFRSTDNGNNWVQTPLPWANVYALAINIAGDIFAGTFQSGGAYRSTDNGNSWTALNSGLSSDALSFAINSDGYIFAGTYGCGVFRSVESTIPVELISFTAIANNDDVTLNWSTATETNNQGFEVQRSNGGEFEPIAFVNGNGTTTEVHLYSYIDRNVKDGSYSYRLKQVDYNGSFEYSNVVEVEWRAFNSYLLEQNYPNPFNPSTKIKYSIPPVGTQRAVSVQIKVYDVLGNEIETLVNEEKSAGTYEVTWYAENLPSGVYFYQFSVGSYIETKKMLLLK